MEKEKEVMGMSEEIAQAVDFYLNQLAILPKPPALTDKEKESKEKDIPTPLTELESSTLESFGEELSRLLHEKFSGHWYPEEKLRGSAFRSISYDTRMDAVFLKAAAKASIDRLPERFENVRYYIMFINPGEVKLKNTRLHTDEAKYLWKRGGITEEDEEPSSPQSPVDLKIDAKLKESTSSYLLSPTSVASSSPPPTSDSPSPRYSSTSSPSPTSESPTSRYSPVRVSSRTSGDFKERIPTSAPILVSHTSHAPPLLTLHRKINHHEQTTSFSNGVAPLRSPSPPPLSLDQPFSPPPLPLPTYQAFSTGYQTDSYIHGHTHYALPRRSVGTSSSTGILPTYTYTAPKYTAYTPPRSRTPSPPLLPGTTSGSTLPQASVYFTRSHSTPTRQTTHHHPQQTYDHSRHLHPQHDYNRFIPRYRSMVHTRS